MLVRYGVNQRQGRHIVHRNHVLLVQDDVAERWDDPLMHQQLRQDIMSKHPGWNLSGYCLVKEEPNGPY